MERTGQSATNSASPPRQSPIAPRKTVCYTTAIIVCAVVALVLLLVPLLHGVLPPPINKTLFATPLSLTELTEKVAQKRPGFYCISTWNETGAVGDETAYLARWLDFPGQYILPSSVYACHIPEKAPHSPALTAFLQAQNITTLPAILVIDDAQTVTRFENIAYGSILNATDAPTQAFVQYLAQHCQ